MLHKLYIKVLHFFHYLFSPHCLECEDKEKELSICPNCEFLKMELEKERQERNKIIDSLLGKKEEVPTAVEQEFEPVKKFIPWHVRQGMLEKEDRKKKQTIEELEREVEVKNDSLV